MAALCNNCGGPLLYSPTRQAMYCNKCGSTFMPEKVVNDSKEFIEDTDAMSVSEVYGFDDKGSYDCYIYSCSHCGGEVAVNATEISTVCPYCGNPTIVFKRVSKAMRPDGIIPFSVSKSEAQMLIRTHLKNGSFIPSEIRNMNAEDIRGIYIPYWIVDCDFYDAVMIKGTKKENDHSWTTFAVEKGFSTFTNLPVDASSRLNDNISERLEPFIYQEAKAFDEDYLSGFYSDTSDMSASALRTAVLKRCDELFSQEVIRNIALDKKTVVRSCPFVDIKDSLVYLMVPAWFYSFKINDVPYTILVNGQTGKTVGALPFNKKKIFTFAAILFLLISILLLLPLSVVNDTGIFAIFELYTSFFLTSGIFTMAIALTKIKRYRKNIQDTHSISTYNYVKKRQD